MADSIVRQAAHHDNEAILELVRSNPIRSNMAYIMDRGPDYFLMHKHFPGSVTLVAEEQSSAKLASCLTMFKFEGRVHQEVVPLAYSTDFSCHPERRQTGSLSRLIGKHLETVNASRAQAHVCLINEGNEVPLIFCYRRLGKLGTLHYTELVPWKKRRLPDPWEAATAEDEEQLSEALALINEHYGEHQLFRPFETRDFDSSPLFPGFGLENVIRLSYQGSLAAAYIHYDPSQLVNVHIVEMDRCTRLGSKWIGRAARVLRSPYRPPGEGETVRTIHLQALAYQSPAALRVALRHMKNLAITKKAHSISFLRDAKEPWPVRLGLAFRFPCLLCGRSVGAGKALADFPTDKPLYFNATCG